MKFSDIKDISRELSESIVTERMGPRVELDKTPSGATAVFAKSKETKMPYGAIWLSVLLVTLCSISLLFGIASISVLNVPMAIVLIVVGLLFGWLTYKSVGWTETL